jgi:hypothetical protein
VTTQNSRPVWGADVPVSMPLPPGEPVLVEMYGMGMTQFRLVHDLTQREYESLSVPVYQPRDPRAPLSQDDQDIDNPPSYSVPPAPQALPQPASPVVQPAFTPAPALVPPVPGLLPFTPPGTESAWLQDQAYQELASQQYGTIQ